MESTLAYRVTWRTSGGGGGLRRTRHLLTGTSRVRASGATGHATRLYGVAAGATRQLGQGSPDRRCVTGRRPPEAPQAAEKAGSRVDEEAFLRAWSRAMLTVLRAF